MTKKDARVLPLWNSAATNAHGAQLGRIDGVDANGNIVVNFPGSSQSHTAKLAVALDAAQLQHAVESCQAVVLVFESTDPTKPIIVGFVTATPILGTAADIPTPTADVIEADVDGRRVKLVGKDEIVLECGQASITLRRNGRVVIRGTHIESYSDGTNRIKGGQVRIN
jgi:uncharacterized protein (DUF2345 family)